MSVSIVHGKCKCCKACYTNCPADVIGWDMRDNHPFIAHVDECNHCGVCAMECQHGAIKHVLPPSARTEINKRYISPVWAPQKLEGPADWLPLMGEGRSTSIK